jgi:hypothetical protein
MNRYTLSNEGRARFQRRKISADLGMETIAGYEVLDCLFENGSATVEEIEDYTGLSWAQVINKLSDFIHWGYIEELAKPHAF